MFPSARNILVVAAHPDDEVFGCGGTIVSHVKAGDEVQLLVLADGVSSRDYMPRSFPNIILKKNKKSVSIRKNEFINAMSILGIKKEKCRVLELPDQRLDAIPLLDVIREIEATTIRSLPDLVYTHHWGDMNKDHRITCEAVMTAFRPGRQIRQKKTTSMWCFEIAGNMGVLPPRSIYQFKSEQVVDITAFMELKIKALRAYGSELREYPDPLSPKKVMELASYRGRIKNYQYAEAFDVLF